MIEAIIELLYLFSKFVSDQESNTLVRNLAEDRKQYINAHQLFDKIRDRNLQAIENKEETLQSQYNFEETCLKAIYNLTSPVGPFDSDAPYWIIGDAIILAEQLDIQRENVLNIIAPNKENERGSK